MFELDLYWAPARHAQLPDQGCHSAQREFGILLAWPDGGVLDRIGIAGIVMVADHDKAGVRLPGSLESGEYIEGGPEIIGTAEQRVERPELLQLETRTKIEAEERITGGDRRIFHEFDIETERDATVGRFEIGTREAMPDQHVVDRRALPDQRIDDGLQEQRPDRCASAFLRSQSSIWQYRSPGFLPDALVTANMAPPAERQVMAIIHAGRR